MKDFELKVELLKLQDKSVRMALSGNYRQNLVIESANLQ